MDRVVIVVRVRMGDLLVLRTVTNACNKASHTHTYIKIKQSKAANEKTNKTKPKANRNCHTENGHFFSSRQNKSTEQQTNDQLGLKKL